MIRCACKLVSVVLLLVLLVGSALSASKVRLIGTRVEPQPDGSNLVVITFDKPVGAVLLNKEGREFGIMIKGLQSSSSGLSLDGDVVGYRLRDETLTVETGRYMRASLLSGGTGTLILSLSPSSGSVKTGSGEVIKARRDENAVVQPDEKSASASPVGKPAAIPVPSRKLAAENSSYEKALKYIKQGNAEQAVKELKQIKPGESRYGESRLQLGNLLMSLNKPVSAIAAYEEAAKQPGTREAATIKLAVAYQRIGAPEKAEQYWANALSMVEKKSGAPDGKAGENDSQNTGPAKNRSKGKQFSFRLGDLREIAPYLIIILFLLVGGGLIGLRVLQNNRMKRVMERLARSNMEEEGEEVHVREEITEPAPSLKNEETESEQRDLAKELAAWQTGQEEPEIEPQSANGTGDTENADETEDGEEPRRGRPAKWERIEEMHRSGAEVREIAETLGLGQDEVKTAISLMEEQKTA